MARAMLAVVTIVAITLRVTILPSLSWWMVLSPVLSVASLHMLVDMVTVCMAVLIVGCRLVDRTDDAARRAVTIRGKSVRK